MVLSFLQGKAFGSGSLLNTSFIKIGFQIYNGMKKIQHIWQSQVKSKNEPKKSSVAS